MTSAIVFDGPDGDYTISLPAVADFEDRMLRVCGHDGAHTWHVETSETGDDGVVTLSGLTRGGQVLWFVLRLSEPAEITYWADRVRVRTDKAR